MNELQMLYQGYLANGGNLDFRSYILSLLPAESNTQGDMPTDIPQNINEPMPTEEVGVSPFSTNEYVSEHNAVGVTENQSVNNPIVGNNQVVNNTIVGDSQYPNTQVAGLPIDINSQVVNNQLANNQFAIDEDGQVQSVDNNTYGNVSTYPTNEYQSNEQGSATPTNTTTPTNIQDDNNVETTQQQGSSPAPTEKPKDAIKKYNEQINILKGKSKEIEAIDKQLTDPKYKLIQEVNNNLENIKKEDNALEEEYKGVTEIPQDIKDIKFKIDNTKETPSERERYEAYINGDYKRYLEYAEKKNALSNKFNAEQGRLSKDLVNEYSSLVDKRNSIAKEVSDTMNSNEYKELQKYALEENKNTKKAGNERKKIQYNGQSYIYDPATKGVYKINKDGKAQRVTNRNTIEGIEKSVTSGGKVNNGKGKTTRVGVYVGNEYDGVKTINDANAVAAQEGLKDLAKALNGNPSEQKKTGGDSLSISQKDLIKSQTSSFMPPNARRNNLIAIIQELESKIPDENSEMLQHLPYLVRAKFNVFGKAGADVGIKYANDNKDKIELEKRNGKILYYHKDGTSSTEKKDASDKVAWKIVDKKFFEEYIENIDSEDADIRRYNDLADKWNLEISKARLKAEKPNHSYVLEEFNNDINDVYKKYSASQTLTDNDTFSSFKNINDKLWYHADDIAKQYVKTHRGVDFNTIRNNIYNDLQGGSEQKAEAKIVEFFKHYRIGIDDSSSNTPENKASNEKEYQTLNNLLKDKQTRLEFGRYLMSKGVPSLNSLNFDPYSRIGFLKGFIGYMAGRSKINEEIVKNYISHMASKDISKMNDADKKEHFAKIKAATDSLEFYRKKNIAVLNFVDNVAKNSEHYQNLTKLNSNFQASSINGNEGANILKDVGAVVTAGLGSVSSLIGSVLSAASIGAGLVSKDWKDYLEKNAIIFKDGNFFSDIDFKASVFNETNFFKNSDVIQFNGTFIEKGKNGKYKSVILSEREKANLEIADTKYSFSISGALSTVTRTITDILVTRRIGSAFPFLSGGARDSVSWALYTFGDNYTDGLRAGLSGGKAVAYGMGQSIITGLMARISPDEWMFKDAPANAKLALFNSIFGQVGAKRNVAYYKEVFTHFFKSIGKEVASENIQELSELVAGKAFSSVMNKITGSKLDGISSINSREVLETVFGTTIGTSALAAYNHRTNKRDNVIDVNGRTYLLSELDKRQRYALMSNFDIREHVDALKKRFEKSPEALEVISKLEDKVNLANEYKGEYSEYLPLEDVANRIKLGQQESKISSFIEELNKKDSLTDKEKQDLDKANRLLEEKRNAIKELDDKGAVLKKKFGESNKGKNNTNNTNNPNGTQDDSLLDEDKGEDDDIGDENNHILSYNGGMYEQNGDDFFKDGKKVSDKSTIDELKKLIDEKEQLLEAIGNDASVLKDASDDLRNDKDFVLKAIRRNEYALDYASDSLKNDKEFILKVLKIDGYSLEFASDRLKDDKDVVSKAVKKEGRSLSYASERLRDDKDVVLTAIKRDESALEFASERLKNDKDFISEVDKIKAELYSFGDLEDDNNNSKNESPLNSDNNDSSDIQQGEEAENENNTPIDVNNDTHNNNVSNNIGNDVEENSNKPNNTDNDSNKGDDIINNNTNNKKGNNKVDNKQNKKGNKNIDNNVDSNTQGDNIDTTSQKKGSGKGTTNNNVSNNNDFNPNDYFHNNDNNDTNTNANTNTNTNPNDKNKDVNRNSYDDKFEGLDREPIKTTRNGNGYTKEDGVWSKDGGKNVKGQRVSKEVRNRVQIDNLDSDAYEVELKRLEKRRAKLYKDYKKDKGIIILENSKEVSNNNIHKVLKDIDEIINFYSLKDVKGNKTSKILKAIYDKGYSVKGIDLKKIINKSLNKDNKGIENYFEEYYNDKHKGLKDIDDAYNRAKSKLEDKYKRAKRKAKYNNKNSSNKGENLSSDEKINIKDEKNTIFGDKNKDKGDIANKEESEKPKKESKKEKNVESKPKKEKEVKAKKENDKDSLDEEKQKLLKEKNKLYSDLEDAVELFGKKKDLESIISKIEENLQEYKKKADAKKDRTEQEIKDDNKYIEFITKNLEDYKRRLAELEDSMDKLGLKGVDINKLKRDTSKAVKDIDNKLRDITNRRKDIEASENANIEPNSNSDKVSDNKSDSNTSLNKDRADDVFMMDISDIHTDEKRFQGRDKLNEDAVERIAKNFNYKDQDPIHIWKDPKNGKYYVLSGHHRLEGAKRADGITKVKVVDKSADFKTEEEAINFAKREANYNRTQETIIESANTLRDLINQERNETDKGKLEKIRTQIKDFLRMLMANATSVRNLAYLNPKGKVISALKNLERSNDDTYNFVLGRAKWIGAVREKYPVITDEHERELFDSLMSEEGVKAITNKGDFLKKVGDIVKSSDFDAKLPINILNLTSKSYLETEWEEKMKELESEKKSYENKINELEGRFNDPTRDDFVNINDPYYKEKRAYADMEIESLKGKIANINNKINAHYKNKSEVDKFVKNQLSIFDDSDLFNSSNESDNNNENINNKDEEQSKSKGISDTKPLGEKKSGQSGNLFEQEDESERGDNRGRQGVGDNDAGARPLSRHNEPLGGETESESGKAVGDVFDKKSGRDIQDNEHSDEQQDKGNSDNAILEDRGRSREESDVSGVNVDEKKRKDSKKVTNEDIDREVEELTSVDDKTKLVSVNGEVSTEAKGRLAQYKSGGESKKGRGILDEYYTNTKIVNAIGNLIKGLFNGKGDIKVLEPSIGTGNFLSLLSKLGVKSDVTAFEINRTTAGISAINYPNAKIYNRSYETEFVDEKGEQKNIVGRYGKYDLVIGNPPYGERSGYIKGIASSKDENVEEAKINKWEDYFVKRSLDQLREGGILAMVLPSGWINRQKNINAELVGAYRLPNGVFGGTNVGTDIIILRKGKLGNDGIDISSYFEENPSHILGEVSKGAGQWGSDLVKGNLEDAIERLKDLHKDAFDGDSDTDVNKHLIKNTDNKVNEEENSTGGKDAKTNKDNSDKEKGDEENANDYVVQDSPKINKKDLKYHFVKNDEQVSANTLNDTNNISEKEANALRQTDYKGEFKELTDDVKPYANMIDGKWVHDFYYAEGNIYEKLEKLENEKHKMPQSQYEKQKALLESVKPKPKGINDIDITPNHEIVSDFKFVDDESGESISLADAFINYLGGLPSEAFGSSSRRDVYEYVKNQRVTGNDATDNTRRRKARKEVGEYLFKQFLEKELPKVVVDSFLNEFNRVYNNLHTPDHSKFPLFVKVNKNFKGKPLSLKIVQKAGIGRLTAKGVGLLAHEVGFGKTLSGIIAIHEAMERGNAKRPVIVVPNDNILEQWVETIYETMPNAKVNILGNLGSKVDLSNFEVRDGEITIITEAGLKNIGFPEDIVNKYSKDFTYISKELDSTPRKEEQLKEKSEELAGRLVGGSKYNWLDFGFDHLTFDEAHHANHIVEGVKVEARNSSDFRHLKQAKSNLGIITWIASRYIQEQNDGRNVTLLTATPFTNKPLEIYSILSLMGNDRLKEMGFFNVNNFFETFIDASYNMEVDSRGNVVEKVSVRGFKNNGLLQLLFSEYIDFKGEADNPDLIRPNKQNEEYKVEPNSLTNEMMSLNQKLLSSRDAGSLLKGITNGRMIAVSPYLSSQYEGVIPDAKEYVENSPKLKATMDLIAQNKKDNPNAGQIIYSEIGTDVFPKLKEYLVNELGYKDSEVAIIDGKTKGREKIQDDYNKGKVKILIGSSTIQAGMNLQFNTSDMYILSLPYNFTALKQLEGRAWRQGNKWENLRVNYMLTNNSSDVFLLQRIQEKQERYNNLKQTNASRVDVSDIDAEELKFSLITDPVKRAEAEYSLDKQKLEYQKKVITQELSVKYRLFDRLESLKNELKNTYYQSVKDRKQKEIKAVENKIKESGLSYDDYENAKAKADKETGVIDKKLEELKEQFPALIAKYKKEVEERESNVKETDFTSKRAEDNKTFYKLREEESKDVKNDKPDVKKVASDESKHNKDGEGVQFQKQSDATKSEFRKVEKGKFMEFIDKAKAFLSNNPSFKNSRVFFDKKEFAKRTGNEEVKYFKTSDGHIYGAKFPNGDIYFDEDVLNYNTAIHEFSHLWEQMFPKSWAKGLELFKQTKTAEAMVSKMKKEGNNNHLTEEQMYSEAMNTYIGNKGEAMQWNNEEMPSKAIDKFKKWFSDLMAKVGQRFGFDKRYDRDMTATDKFGEFADSVINDITGGKAINAERYFDEMSNEHIIDLFKDKGIIKESACRI